jgi:hypothetical protein
MLSRIGGILPEDNGLGLAEIDVALVGIVEKQTERHLDLGPDLGRNVFGMGPEGIFQGFGIARCAFQVNQRQEAVIQSRIAVQPEGEGIRLGYVLKGKTRCDHQRIPVTSALGIPTQFEAIVAGISLSRFYRKFVVGRAGLLEETGRRLKGQAGVIIPWIAGILEKINRLRMQRKVQAQRKQYKKGPGNGSWHSSSLV